MKTRDKVLLGIGGVVVVALLAVGAWQLVWWMRGSAATHNAHIFQQSYGAQSASIEQLRSDITDVANITVQIADPHTPSSEVPSLTAQRVAVTNQACGVAQNITPPLPTNEAAFVAANC